MFYYQTIITTNAGKCNTFRHIAAQTKTAPRNHQAPRGCFLSSRKWTNRTINRTFLSSSAVVLFFFSSRDPFIKPPHNPGHLRGRRVSFLIKQIIFSHFRSALPPGRQICRPRCTFRTCWPGSWPPGWALNTAAGTRLSCGRCRNISNKTQKQPRGPDGSRGCCYMYGR